MSSTKKIHTDDETMEVIEEDKCLINRLPDEIMVLFLKKIDMDHLLNEVPRVCSRWSRLAQDKYVWKGRGLIFDEKQKDNETYVKDFVKTLNEVPYLSSLNLSKVPVEVVEAEEAANEDTPSWPTTKVINKKAGANFQRNIGLASLCCNTYFEGLLDLIIANRETLSSVMLHNVEVDKVGSWDQLENVKIKLSEIMKALIDLPCLKHLSLEFNEIWEFGDIEQWYEELDHIVYSSLLQMNSLKSLELIHAKPLIRSVPSPPPGSWKLSALEIEGESYFNDDLAALMVSAATSTLQVFRAGHNGGLKTMKALKQCQNLESLNLPCLKNLEHFKDLKKVHSLELYSLEEHSNPNSRVDEHFVSTAPLLGNLKNFTITATSNPANYCNLMQALINKCKEVQKFSLLEFYIFFQESPFVRLAPLTVKSIVGGAMPKLCTLEIKSYGCGDSKAVWEEPLKQLKEKRPALTVLF